MNAIQQTTSVHVQPQPGMSHVLPVAAEPADQQAAPAPGIDVRLVEARLMKGFTHHAIAKKAGLKAAELRTFEKAKAVPSLEQVRGIAAALGVTTAWLWLGREASVPGQQAPEPAAATHLTGPALIAEIERLHAIEMDPGSWPDSGELDPSAGDSAQRAMWPLMKAALADPATVADPQLLARVTRCVIRSAGTEELPDRAGLLLAETVLSSASGAGADAELIGLCEEFCRLEVKHSGICHHEHPDYIEDQERQDAALDPIVAAQRILVGQIRSIGARTVAGLQAKARALVAWDEQLPTEEECTDTNQFLLNSILRDLLGGDGTKSSLTTPPPLPQALTINPDADYIALCDEIVRLEREWESTGRHEDTLPDKDALAYEETVRGPIYDKQMEVFERLRLLQPKTAAGQGAAARAALAYMHCSDDNPPEISHDGQHVVYMLIKQLAGQPAPVPADPDADLKAGCNELIASINQMSVEAADITSNDPRHTQQHELVERILAQAPHTLDGHQLRAQAILAWHGGMGGNGKPASELHQDDFWLVIRDLIGASTIKGMAQRTAAICASYPATVP